MAVAKDFMKYLIQPEVVNNYLKEGLGRFARRSHRSSKATRSGWPTRSAPPDVTEGVDEAVAGYPVFNPGWAEVNAQQVWGQPRPTSSTAAPTRGMLPGSTFAKIEAILAKYPIVVKGTRGIGNGARRRPPFAGSALNSARLARWTARVRNTPGRSPFRAAQIDGLHQRGEGSILEGCWLQLLRLAKHKQQLR